MSALSADSLLLLSGANLADAGFLLSSSVSATSSFWKRLKALNAIAAFAFLLLFGLGPLFERLFYLHVNKRVKVVIRDRTLFLLF